MYIEPQTNIKILKDVPLDNTYEHTIFFGSALLQQGYFSYLKKYDLSNYTYQRVQRGVARVGIKADNLYDCNYMMFQNTAYGTKWFYAFITGVEFVNNEMSQITFEIDVMQTWFFDCEPDYCFVEREHADSDEIGDNILPESVATGEYVFNDYNRWDWAQGQMCVVIAIVDTSQLPSGNLYDGIYGGATLYSYNSTDVTGINGLLQEFQQKPDAVIGMYMVPYSLLGSVSTSVVSSDHIIPSGTAALRFEANMGPAIAKTATLDGYLPKNAKLYTYPYNYMHVDNASGQSLLLRYEFFDGLRARVETTGTITQPVKVCLRPTHYKNIVGSSGDELTGKNTCNTESLELANYPMCSWNFDAYQAWVAQNSVPIALNAVNGVASDIGKAVTGNVAGAASGALGQITGVISQYYQASIKADISRGSLNNGGVNTASNKQSFYYGRCSVTAQYAKMIDDYFSKFGYATNQLKKPNRNVRLHWTYTKTIGCTITGSVPADDMRKICSIYDHGITFWRNGSEVGQYNLSNPITGQTGQTGTT